MENYVATIIAVGVLMATLFAVFVIYRWRQEARVSRINAWVHDYLQVRYGEPPIRLNIKCTYDTHWPVLVDHDTPATGTRHSLQFMCQGAQPTWFLLSETDQ